MTLPPREERPPIRACALPEMAMRPPPTPDTQEEEQATSRPPEAAMEGGQVRFDDEKLIGNAFVMMGLSGG